MSHTTTLKGLQIKDISALKAAIRDLNKQGVKCSLAENERPRMYYSNQGENCEYVIQLENCKYDIGLKKQKDGTYSPQFDEWHGIVAGQVGATCPMPGSKEGKVQHQIGKVLQTYGKHAAIKQAQRDGHTVESSTMDSNGDVQLVLAVNA